LTASRKTLTRPRRFELDLNAAPKEVTDHLGQLPETLKKPKKSPPPATLSVIFLPVRLFKAYTE
jgi:hypothetical protein